jgi:hypothetical protein
MTCPGYPNAVAGLHDPGSEFAAEGTAAHSIADDCLTLGLDAHDFIGSKLTVTEKGSDGQIAQSWTFEWTEDDAEDLQYGIDEVRALGGEFFGEHRVDLSEVYGVEGQFGTLDRGIITPDEIIINDLKWGKGIPDQPRCPGGGGHWSCSIDELLAFQEEVRAAARATLDPNAPRKASEKGCYWCARRKQSPTEPGAVSGCKTYDDYMLDAIGSRFDDLDEAIGSDSEIVLPQYSQLSAERRSYIVRHKGSIEKWLEAIHAAVIRDGLNGESIPGLKVVDGRRGRKAWVDEDKADTWLAERLGNDRFTFKLNSPSQALKALKGDARKELLDSGLFREGVPKPVLVDEADERPRKATVDEKFDEML